VAVTICYGARVIILEVKNLLRKFIREEQFLLASFVLSYSAAQKPNPKNVLLPHDKQ